MRRKHSELGNDDSLQASKKHKSMVAPLFSQLPNEIVSQFFLFASSGVDRLHLALVNQSTYQLYETITGTNLESVRLHYLNEKEKQLRRTGNAMMGFSIEEKGNLIHVFSDLEQTPPSATVAVSQQVIRATSMMDTRKIWSSITLEQFENYWRRNAGPIGVAVLDVLFECNSLSLTGPKFLVAGGFVAQFFIDRVARRMKRLRPKKKPYQFQESEEDGEEKEEEGEEDLEPEYGNAGSNNTSEPDIDIFVMENGATPEQVHFFLKDALLKIEQVAKSRQLDYALMKNNSTINITPKSMDDPLIQFILRRVYNIEELMNFFDLDCCRFSFDAGNVYTIYEGIRSMMIHTNILEPCHEECELYFKRAIKYAARGIETLLFDSIDRFSHVLPLEYWAKRVKSKEDGCMICSISSNNDMDAGMYTVFNTVRYPEIIAISKKGLKSFLRNVNDEFWIQNNYRSHWEQSFKWAIFKEMDELVSVDHMFLLSITELFERDYTIFITEGYLEKHLMEKYLFHKCYMCGHYQKLLHQGETYICTGCAQKNESMKNLERDLSGKVAIVTGARIKIGFSTALKLLRCNATVIGTTRFLEDAKDKFSRESDYNEFSDRLILFGLNLKDGHSIREFVEFVQSKFDHVDILINNAAQTVRRPLQYYRRLLKKEKNSLLGALNSSTTDDGSNSRAVSTLVLNSSTLDRVNNLQDPIIRSQYLTLCSFQRNLCKEDGAPEGLFPLDKTDRFGEPLDLRKENTWTTTIDDVDTVEMLEVQLINQIAPTMLVSQLFPLMMHKKQNEEQDEEEDEEEDEGEGESEENNENDRAVNAENESNSNVTCPSNGNNKEDNKGEEARIHDDKEEVNILSPRLGPSYIINVTSHEGQFATTGKTDYHIHTNMSKAALNMLTRSSSHYFASHGVLMNGVDTGWISSGIQTYKEPPLTCEDGAARILHPILSSSGKYGLLLKDFEPTHW